MLAVRIRQKGGEFYFISYKARDLLERVRFTRLYYETEEERTYRGEDEVSLFIQRIERSDKAFQRKLMRRKVAQILDFFLQAQEQPIIPGTVLLYTSEKLKFEPIPPQEMVGDLSEPEDKFIIIDGQHRLAGLKLFAQKRPEEIDRVEVPCIIFDGRAEDFAVEMFVIINSTHTRISKSHLIDLYERISYVQPEERFSARLVKMLYEEPDSPLRYRINRLGGRSTRQKWILQSELYREIHRLVSEHSGQIKPGVHQRAEMIYRLIRDYLSAVSSVMAEIWGRKGYRFTESVTIKALIRVLSDLLSHPGVWEKWQELRKTGQGEEVFERIIEGWRELIPEFREVGFYERFPARGPVERVRKIQEALKRKLNHQALVNLKEGENED